MENIRKAGFVSIIGRPNSGKSTLLNKFLETKISIVTPKAQTTRKSVIGIDTESSNQIVFFDTPGILKPEHKLHEAMLKYIDNSFEDADLIILLIEIGKLEYLENIIPNDYLKKFRESNKPKFIVLNKIDTVGNIDEIVEKIKLLFKGEKYDELFFISSTVGTGIKELKEEIIKYLPESEFYYDEEIISHLPIKFFVSEIIREFVFLHYSKEIPYSTEVIVSEFKERQEGKWYISAEIVVERISQKKIIIGKNGKKIKELGIESRAAIEEYLGAEVYLELFVKVRKNWRKNDAMLKSFGYKN